MIYLQNSPLTPRNSTLRLSTSELRLPTSELRIPTSTPRKDYIRTNKKDLTLKIMSNSHNLTKAQYMYNSRYFFTNERDKSNNFIRELDNQQLFSLNNNFEEHSLEDNTEGSSSSSTSSAPSSSSSSSSSSTSSAPSSSSSSSLSLTNSSYLHPILGRYRQSVMNPTIVNNIRAPSAIIERPLHLYDPLFGICFQFLPGNNNTLNIFKLSSNFDRLLNLRNSLGLSRNNLNSLSFYSSGLRSLIDNGSSKIIVSAKTYYNGFYFRFIIQVCLGIGCTVWYGFVPGVAEITPDFDLFKYIMSYEPFFNEDYNPSKFRRVRFIESQDVSEQVITAFANEHPFSEIKIPATGSVLTAVGIGVMIAIFIAAGIAPDSISEK